MERKLTRREFLGIAGAGLVGATLLGGSGCAGQGSGSSEDINRPIVIGMTSAVTGPYSEFGEGISRGAQLAIDEWNENGGINGQEIEFRVLDDQLDADRAVSNFRRLLSEELDAGILPAGSGPTLAVLPLALESGKPFVNPIAQTIEITYPNGTDSPPSPNIFSTAIQNDVEAEIIGGFVVQEGFDSVGLIAESTPYGQTGLDILEERFADAGIEVVAREQYDQGTTSTSAQLGNVNADNPDTIIAIGLGADAATIAQDLNRLGIEVPFIGTFGLFSTPFVELAGDLVPGKYAALIPTYAGSSLSDLGQPAREFAEKYLAEYGNDRWYTEAETPPPFFQQNAAGYDGINALLTSIEQASSLNSEEIINQLNGYSYEGAQLPGTVGFSEEKHHAVTTNAMSMGRYVSEGDRLAVETIEVETS